jgi:hypothetical protein
MIKLITDTAQDLVKPTHNKLVGGLGVISIVLGIIANLKQYGYTAALIFIIASVTALFVLMSEISCVLSGKCYTTALLNTSISIIIFGGIIVYYGRYLFGNLDLPEVSQQPIVKVDRAVVPVTGVVQAQVTKILDNKNLNKVE